MKPLFIILYLALTPFLSIAQGENNIWTFAGSSVGNNTVLNFNSPSPFFATIPSQFDNLGYGAAVCSTNGNLRFFVRLADYTSFGSTFLNIYLPDGTPISGSNLKCSVAIEWSMPVIIPHPNNPNQYYIFYGYSKGLLYSLLDMSLNNGAGGIVTGQKDVIVSPFGSIVSQKMTAVKGCSGVWLVIRSRIENAYYSFLVDKNGFHPEKIVSNIGLFSMYNYNQVAYGYLKASIDGRRLAISTWGGVELYDFESCSGIVKNARLLDTTGNAELNQVNYYNHYRYDGICFSPDGTKLYVSKNHRSETIPVGTAAGELYQYDLAQSTPTAIVASKLLIFTNQASIMENGLTCSLIVPNPLGEIKQGSDGKLYIDNGSYTCLSPSNIPTGYNPGPAFHVINQPNNLGTSCQPVLNFKILNDYNGNMGESFYGDGRSSQLQQDIIVAEQTTDTAEGNSYSLKVCFRDSLVLNADSFVSCYLWDDLSKDRKRTVFSSGTYYVSYFNSCSYTTDTFHVAMTKIPKLFTMESCPDMFMGNVHTSKESSDTSRVNYLWLQIDSSIISSHQTMYNDTIKGLNPGDYLVRISTLAGCDTILPFTINALQKPDVHATPKDTTIHYGDSIRLYANGAMLYVWLPSGLVDSSTIASPIAKPLKPTDFMVIGLNEYGCRDSASARIKIDYAMPDFVPNAFSPNGDGLNDVFSISNITYQKIVQFKIYNRFGQLIFSTMDGHKGWNGIQNGKNCDVGTYYYLIELDYPNGTRKTYKGDVSLIR